MIKNVRNILWTACAISMAMAYALPAKADAVADFYKGRTVTVVIPAGMGGSIGLYGKLFADHVGRHIPGKPNVLIQTRPGSGGIKAASYTYNAAPKDGTVIAQLLSPAILAPVLRNAKFDASKFMWLGSISPRSSVLSVWHTAPAKTVEDVKTNQIVLAAGGRATSNYIIPTLLNKIIGTKFKIVTGYKGGGNMNLAVESGEVHGRYIFWTGWTTRKADWIRDGKIRTIVQIGPRIAALPKVPSARDLASSPEHKQMFDFMSLSERVGLAFYLPPGSPRDRMEALRKSFMATMKDPDFLAAAKKRNAPINPVSGAEIAGIVSAGYKVPPEVLRNLKTMVGFGKKKK
jgi:tripartite-type tricarboxylate transporter receptor subunit TctC